MVIAEIDARAGARRRSSRSRATGGRAVTVVADVRESGVADALVTDGARRVRPGRRARQQRRPLRRRAQGVPRAVRRRVGRALPRQPRPRARVHARRAAGAHRAGRRRQHRERLDDRGVPRDPDARGVLRVQVGDHRPHAQPGGRVRPLPDPGQRDRARRDRDAAGALLALGRRPTRSTSSPRGSRSAGSAPRPTPPASPSSSRPTSRASSPAPPCTPTAGRSPSSGWFPTEEGGWTNRPRKA